MWHFGLPWEIFSKWNLLMEWSFISLTWWRKSKPMNEEMIKRASSFIAFQSKWFSVLLRIFYIFKRLFFRKPFIFFFGKYFMIWNMCYFFDQMCNKEKISSLWNCSARKEIFAIFRQSKYWTYRKTNMYNLKIKCMFKILQTKYSVY